MSGGTWHPDGCRCSGCRQPAARVPARPSRPAASQPVYRRPRSHAWSCRCPRCAGALRRSQGNAGIIGPLILIGGIIALVGFWPAMVWHGYGGPTGTAWEWNTDSTIGCCVWWSLTIVPLLVAAIVDACRKRAVRVNQRA